MSWLKKLLPDKPKKPTMDEYNAVKADIMNKYNELDKKVAEGVKIALEKQRYNDLRASLKKEVEAFRASYTPKGPRYKITESPSGGYNIKERRIRFNSLDDLRNYNEKYGRIPLTIVQLEEFRPKAREEYIPLYETTPNMYGKVPKLFSTFDEAEYFLLRMASPDAYETHYDGEPLHRVTKTSTR